MNTFAPAKTPLNVAFVGCWYKKDMYSHNCSNLVDALRSPDVGVHVITSNCRCFSSAQDFRIAKDELINHDCSVVAIPHAPSKPTKKHGALKFVAVKGLRLDLWLAAMRGFIYYNRCRRSDLVHFDQVLEAFGSVPLFVLIVLCRLTGKRVIVTVHEVDAFQQKHLRLNRLYDKCSQVFVYSEHMKSQLVQLGVNPEKIKTIRYGTVLPEIRTQVRDQYIYFGGHNILKGKGYEQLLGALLTLKNEARHISLVIYTGHGCNGLTEAKALASQYGVADMITWSDFYTTTELAEAYQKSKACIIPYTGGSARHPVTCAMANATPIIATNKIDIPEYVGDLGIYVDGSAASIAAAVHEIEEGKDLNERRVKLRERAVSELAYDKLAKELRIAYTQTVTGNDLVNIEPASAA